MPKSPSIANHSKAVTSPSNKQPVKRLADTLQQTYGPISKDKISLPASFKAISDNPPPIPLTSDLASTSATTSQSNVTPVTTNVDAPAPKKPRLTVPKVPNPLPADINGYAPSNVNSLAKDTKKEAERYQSYLKFLPNTAAEKYLNLSSQEVTLFRNQEPVLLIQIDQFFLSLKESFNTRCHTGIEKPNLFTTLEIKNHLDGLINQVLAFPPFLRDNLISRMHSHNAKLQISGDPSPVNSSQLIQCEIYNAVVAHNFIGSHIRKLALIDFSNKIQLYYHYHHYEPTNFMPQATERLNSTHHNLEIFSQAVSNLFAQVTLTGAAFATHMVQIEQDKPIVEREYDHAGVFKATYVESALRLLNGFIMSGELFNPLVIAHLEKLCAKLSDKSRALRPTNHHSVTQTLAVLTTKLPTYLNKLQLKEKEYFFNHVEEFMPEIDILIDCLRKLLPVFVPPKTLINNTTGKIFSLCATTVVEACKNGHQYGKLPNEKTDAVFRYTPALTAPKEPLGFVMFPISYYETWQKNPQLNLPRTNLVPDIIEEAPTTLPECWIRNFSKLTYRKPNTSENSQENKTLLRFSESKRISFVMVKNPFTKLSADLLEMNRYPGASRFLKALQSENEKLFVDEHAISTKKFKEELQLLENLKKTQTEKTISTALKAIHGPLPVSTKTAGTQRPIISQAEIDIFAARMIAKNKTKNKVSVIQSAQPTSKPAIKPNPSALISLPVNTQIDDVGAAQLAILAPEDVDELSPDSKLAQGVSIHHNLPMTPADHRSPEMAMISADYQLNQTVALTHPPVQIATSVIPKNARPSVFIFPEIVPAEYMLPHPLASYPDPLAGFFSDEDEDADLDNITIDLSPKTQAILIKNMLTPSPKEGVLQANFASHQSTLPVTNFDDEIGNLKEFELSEDDENLLIRQFGLQTAYLEELNKIQF